MVPAEKANMSEVWIFRGTQPVVWRIPCKVAMRPRSDLRGIYLRRSPERLHLDPAVPLLRCQRTALDKFFAKQKVVEWVTGQWRLKHAWHNYAARLEAMGGVRATSGDPEDHLVWSGRRPPAGKLKPAQKERRAWLEEMLARGGGETLEQLSYQWREFCLHIAHTLINREQPVDFYWFKLHNCPLRADWMNHLGRPAPYLAVNLLRKAMEGCRIMAMDIEGQHCLRHIELEHTAEWWKLVRKAESQRRRESGPEKYARNFQGSLERFALTAWALFWSHRKEVAQAHARRVSHGRRGGFRLVPDPMARNVYGTAYQLVYPPDKATRKSLQEAIAHVQKTLSRAHGGVSKVSDLRPSAKVVRQPEDERAGPAVGQPGDGARGSDGMLLHDGSSRVVSDKEVLAPRAGVGDDGLAGGA